MQNSSLRSTLGSFAEADDHYLRYTISAELISGGLTVELQTRLWAIPGLVEIMTDAIPEQLEGEHQRVIVEGVACTQTAFMATSSGDAEQIRRDLERDLERMIPGFEGAGGVDHLVNLLQHLAGLCVLEGVAIQRDRSLVCRRLRSHQRALCDRHLLRWLPAWVEAVRETESAFYAPFADWLLETVIAHRAMLGEDLVLIRGQELSVSGAAGFESARGLSR